MMRFEAEENADMDSLWGNLSDHDSLFAGIDDLWSEMDVKLECDLFDLPLSDLTFDDREFQDIFNWDLEHKEIVHHDCMWSGTCTDRFHYWTEVEPYEKDRFLFDSTYLQCVPMDEEMPATLAPPRPPSPAPVHSVLPGMSLLLTQQPQLRPQPQTPPQRRFQRQLPALPIPAETIASPPSPRRPDTPQSLDEDDETPQFKHQIDIVACAPVRGADRPVAKYDDDDDEDDEEPEDEEEEEEEDDDDDDDDEYDDEDYRREAYERFVDSRPARESTVASDHSYTLSKNSKPTRIDLPGVCTPSDSEEEIDVVSLGEKAGAGRPPAMPMNPSPLARRQMQRTMASAVAERAGLGARAPPPQPRKRNRERSASPLLRHRKRAKTLAKAAPAKTAPPKRRPYSSNSDSEAENIERRSLHNDMERQRRIGLKNLFDELKMEVPAIREKERAPKVVVLREATTLCKYFSKTEAELAGLKARQQALLNRVKSLRKEFAAKRPKA